MSAIVISRAIPAEIVSEIRTRTASARFVSGAETAIGRAAGVKHNLQLAADDPAERRAVELLVGALHANPHFQAAAWPDAMMRPQFCRYQAGMGYGDHIDGAIMGQPPDLVRCDIAVTACLNDSAEYDGGELMIDTAALPQSWKGEAGDVILYPADTSHRVSEVTRGVREVAVLWIQSLVRAPARRRILFDLRLALDEMDAMNALDQAAGPAPHVAAIRRSYFNLIRMWV